MSVELVHPVPLDELDPWVRQVNVGLLHDPYSPDVEARIARRRAMWRPERAWGARDGGRWVGTLATEHRVITVPGPDGSTCDVASDALTAVSVAATHRRRGLLSALLAQSRHAAKERGDLVSVLIAAEWPIYGRFGYGPAVQSSDLSYFPRRAGAAVPGGSGARVRRLEAEELAPLAPSIFDRARRLRPGQIDRPGDWFNFSLGAPGFERVDQRHNLVLHEGPDGPDGFLGWRVTRDFELDGRYGAVSVDPLVAATDAAYRDLWAFLGSLDLIDEVTLSTRPVDEPLRHLMLDGRSLRSTFLGDQLWLGLLDLPGALAARSYAVEGRLVLDVVDPAPGNYAAGRVCLDASGAGVECRPSRETPDLTVPANVLASAYLGGYGVALLAAAGLVEEHRAGSVQRLDAMMRTPLAPWCQTWF
jgi:predicted acetyltransferase